MVQSKRTRMALGLTCASALWVSFLACGGTPVTPPGPPSSFAPGCGITLFPQQPVCEADADMKCCAQQDQCANDKDCARIAQCWVACDAQATEMKKRGQDNACGCFLNCQPQGTETPGAKNWGFLAACLSTGGPRGASCGSQC